MTYRLIVDKGMAIYSSILAWRIPRTEDPGGQKYMGLQKNRTEQVTHIDSCVLYRHMYFHFSFLDVSLDFLGNFVKLA